MSRSMDALTPPTPDDRLDEISKRLFAEVRVQEAADRDAVRQHPDRWYTKRDGVDDIGWLDPNSDDNCDGE